MAGEAELGDALASAEEFAAEAERLGKTEEEIAAMNKSFEDLTPEAREALFDAGAVTGGVDGNFESYFEYAEENDFTNLNPAYSNRIQLRIQQRVDGNVEQAARVEANGTVEQQQAVNTFAKRGATPQGVAAMKTEANSKETVSAWERFFKAGAPDTIAGITFKGFALYWILTNGKNILNDVLDVASQIAKEAIGAFESLGKSVLDPIAGGFKIGIIVIAVVIGIVVLIVGITFGLKKAKKNKGK